jgi:phage-related minor tail protein
MEFLTQLLGAAVGPHLPQLSAVLIGVVAMGIVQILKAIKSIPLNPGHRVALHGASVVFAFLGNVAAAWATGDPTTADASSVATLLVNTLLSYSAAQATYNATKVAPIPSQPTFTQEGEETLARWTFPGFGK